jgi:hypothetical protein
VQIILPYFDGPWLTEKELDVLSYGGYNAAVQLPDIFRWLWLVAWFVAAGGMLFFLGWARLLFLSWLVLSAFVVAVGGMQTQTAAEGFLSDAGSVFDGMLVALAYFSSLKDRFSREYASSA